MRPVGAGYAPAPGAPPLPPRNRRVPSASVSGVREPETPVGRVASVTTPIPGPGRPGEVVVRIRGGTETYLAYADTAVDAGSEVLVTADRGARAVDVVPGG